MGPWQFQMKHKQRVTHPQEVCGLARARDARVWLVLCVGRPPCPGVISANGMLDLDDLGPAGNQSDAPWQRKTRRAQTHPRSPRICVQYGWCDVSADATLPLRRCRGGDISDLHRPARGSCPARGTRRGAARRRARGWNSDGSRLPPGGTSGMQARCARVSQWQTWPPVLSS